MKARGSRTPKPPLLIFAPFPPARNGIADYVAELMPYHLAEFDVTLVIADEAPIPADPAPRTLLASEFSRHRSFFANASKIYHFGNNPQHCYLLDMIERDPGIAVLHDFNLGYLHEMATLGWGDRGSYLGAMEREYGALGGDIVRWQFDKQFRETFASYEMPLNGAVLESATAVIAHSRQVQYRVAARSPRTPVWYIPHHLSPAVASYSRSDKAVARKRFGLPPDKLVITAVGFVTRAKQIPLTLAALAQLRGKVPPFHFVLGGERRPDEYDVDADIVQSGLGSLITCTDYLDEREFFELLAATDVLVNLRYPSSGEMSGTLVRALGMGVPTIVFDYGPIGELPPTVVRKIAWDSNVGTALAVALRGLMTDTKARNGLGACAAAHVRRFHDIKHMARSYSRIIHESAERHSTGHLPVLRQYMSRPKFVARRLREVTTEANSLGASTQDLWWRAASVPIGAPGEQALVVSERPRETSAFLSLLFQWESSAIVAMTVEEFLASSLRASDGTPIPGGTFALALLTARPKLGEREAALLMRRLNAALRPRGTLILEIRSAHDESPRPDSGHALAEAGMAQRLADSGFGKIRSVSPQEGIIAELILGPNEVEPDHRITCMTAQKTSDYVVWRYLVQEGGLPMRWGGRTGQGSGDETSLEAVEG